jgi:hypothetical protein
VQEGAWVCGVPLLQATVIAVSSLCCYYASEETNSKPRIAFKAFYAQMKVTFSGRAEGFYLIKITLFLFKNV